MNWGHTCNNFSKLTNFIFEAISELPKAIPVVDRNSPTNFSFNYKKIIKLHNRSLCTSFTFFSFVSFLYPKKGLLLYPREGNIQTPMKLGQQHWHDLLNDVLKRHPSYAYQSLIHVLFHQYPLPCPTPALTVFTRV